MNFMFEREQHCSCDSSIKFHIFKQTYHSLFIIWTINIHGRDWKASFITNIGYYHKELITTFWEIPWKSLHHMVFSFRCSCFLVDRKMNLNLHCLPQQILQLIPKKEQTEFIQQNMKRGKLWHYFSIRPLVATSFQDEVVALILPVF